MNILFLMDPLATVDPVKDTTFALMRAAQRRGHATFYVPDGGLSLINGAVSFDTIRVGVCDEADPGPFKIHGPERLDQGSAGAVFIRNDPPFDARYLMNTWLLDRLPRSVPVINSPQGVRTVNEKLWATQFIDLIPPTLVSASLEAHRAFLAEHKDVIAKPANGYGGSEVFRVREGDTNAQVIFEALSGRGGEEIILQRYLPEAEQGDKRILLLDGEPLGAVLRKHRAGEHRNNIFAGGSVHPAGIDAEDRRIIDALRVPLRELGLSFVGIDIIGGRLIEVNVTSPTCIQEMSRFAARDLAQDVIAFAER